MSAKCRDSTPQKHSSAPSTAPSTPSLKQRRSWTSAPFQRELHIFWSTSCLKMRTAMYLHSMPKPAQREMRSHHSIRPVICSAAPIITWIRWRFFSPSCSPLTLRQKMLPKNRASSDKKFGCVTMIPAGGFSSTCYRDCTTTIP